MDKRRPNLLCTLCFLPRSLTHQVVKLRILTEEGLVFSFLLVDKVFNVYIEAGRRDAFGSLRGLFTFLKQQSQQGEQRMSEGDEREKKELSANQIQQDKTNDSSVHFPLTKIFTFYNNFFSKES